MLFRSEEWDTLGEGADEGESSVRGESLDEEQGLLERAVRSRVSLGSGGWKEGVMPHVIFFAAKYWKERGSERGIGEREGALTG